MVAKTNKYSGFKDIKVSYLEESRYLRKNFVSEKSNQYRGSYFSSFISLMIKTILIKPNMVEYELCSLR